MNRQDQLENDTNAELNDLRKFIFMRKSEVSVERISACDVNENFVEHDIHCLPWSFKLSS